MTGEASFKVGTSDADSELTSLGPINKETVQDRVYGSLRTAIMRGQIKPEQNLTIPGVAAAFGTSAMPVRQALFRLAAERALTVVSGRTVGVPPLSRARLRDLTAVRLEVEGLAAAWAARNRPADLAEELTGLVEQMWQDSEAEDASGFLNRNQSFHFAVYRASCSPTLIPIIESLWLQIGPYLNLLHRSGNFQAGNEHHESLREALARGDEAGARSALEADISTAAEVLQKMVTRD